jgi:3',5'-cyclic-AMP phosphodiesterase
MLVLAHVSDIHIDGGERNTTRAARALRYARSLRPDAVVLTGDLADNGLIEEYEIVRELIAGDGAPIVLCPGNHDVRGNLRKALLGLDGDRPVNQVLNLEKATIALCDSSIPGRPEGRLDDETLAWLDGVLAAAPGVPAFVGMHHPATRLGIPYVDGIMLTETEGLREVLARHPHVAAVLAGHAHTAAATTFAGLPLLVAPGVVSTALLPYETSAERPLDLDLPPAIAIHLLDESPGDGRVVTHYRPVP